MSNQINVFTLGCSKNRVDSEILMSQLRENGYTVEHESPENKFNYILLNTCGFIGDAKEESIEMILDFTLAKERGDIDKIIVFGCLSERYKKDLVEEIPEVDAWFGKFELNKMLDYLEAKHFPYLMPNRVITTPKHYAYLKISEGCNRKCSYCAIPRITGLHVSKPIEDLIKETKSLVKQGAKEIIMIAQDLSFYGLDIYKKQMLSTLMEELAQIEGVKWLRIHYTYPASFPMDIMPVMAKYSNICNYMDIALQHISNNVLKLMRRNVSKEQTIHLINSFRKEVPGIALRTTMLVGHPGETEKDFNELKEFVKMARFERLGVFPYSHEEDTFAGEKYEDNVPQEIKEARAEEIMAIQSQISFEMNQAKIGKVFKVLVDRCEGEYFIGRTEIDSPDVDGDVFIKSDKILEIGDFYQIKVYDASEFDLYGEVTS